MKKYYLSLSIIFLVILCSLNVQAQTHDDKMTHVKGDVLVQLLHNKDFDDLQKDMMTINPDFKVQKRFSKALNAYLIQFDPSAYSQVQAQEIMWQVPYVIAVQNNHFVEERANTPLDPQYSTQWHHNNNGGAGGTADADIDTDDAWDITTGGLTDFGDTIVVCILEGSGGDLNHEDLQENAWFNYAEDPTNGVDDDNNGYVDDYRGWNISNNNDNIGAGNHGTAVAGMIGAKGDNNLGVTGVNWDVKLMMVSGFSANTESSVLAAYDYPLTMRQMYNNSNGTEGAFVVVTNASWGINGGDPADAPLWCNMYDTLGYYGILSCGATANNNVNIDQVGDLPTACPSEYLISVTATDNNDERTFSGYGPVNIDIGAPGDLVFLPKNTDDYDYTSGTSFASPLTAGVVALLYSAPCPSFMTIVNDDPALGAEMVRDYIYNGVDVVSYLTGEVATDGRINAFNSLQLLLGDCSSGCIKPYTLTESGITDTDVTLEWNGQATQGYFIQIREVGTSTWSTATVSAATTSLLIDTLTACTNYEYQIKALCNAGAESNLTNIETFQTDGCCENPATLNINNTTDNTITVDWPSVLAANSYDIRYRPVGTSTWSEDIGVTAPHTVSGLEPCTEYEFEIRTVCASQTLTYSNLIIIPTTGCGACFDYTYCAVDPGNTQYEYLDTVEIGSNILSSGNNSGYIDNSSVNGILLGLGLTYNVTMKPGYVGFPYTENFRIFIDYDQDGVFNTSDEMVYQGLNNGNVTGDFTVPQGTPLGLTKMRLYMVDQSSNVNPCITGSYYGEIEDYCVEIVNTASIDNQKNINSIQFFPNPSKGNLTVSTLNKGQLEILTISGQLLRSENISNTITHLNINELSKGVYLLKFTDKNGSESVEKLILQ